MMDGLLETSIMAAKETGYFLLNNRGNARNVESKNSVIDLVTEIDREAEKRIIEKIRTYFPDHDVLGEEGGEDVKGSEYRWIIDPLDGTTNFTHGFPVFCVSIGVEQKGEVCLGVIYDPNLDELFHAVKGEGAFLNGDHIQVSGTNELIKSLLITGFPYDLHEKPSPAIDIFYDFLLKGQAIRRLGSAALDLCYIAAGRGDGFWEVNLHPWDIAAGKLIVEEAGGEVSDFLGNPIDLTAKQILATNGVIHDTMLEVLKERITEFKT